MSSDAPALTPWSERQPCFVSLRLANPDRTLDLVFPFQTSRYNVTTLTKLGADVELHRVAPHDSWPPLRFDARGVALVPPEWVSTPALREMQTKTFHVAATGSPKPMPEDKEKRRLALHQLDAARLRLIKSAPEKAAQLVQELAAGTVPGALYRVEASVSTAPAVAKAPAPEPAPVPARVYPPPRTLPCSTSATSSPPPEPDAVEVCASCGESIPAANMVMHRVACRRQRPCPHCGKPFETSELEGHIATLHRPKPCPHEGCGVALPGAEMPSHVAACEFGTLACTACGVQLSRAQLPFHIAKECSERIVLCPHNGCRVDGTPRAIEGHQSQCHFRLEACRFCETRLPVFELQAHVDRCGSMTQPCPLCSQRVTASGLAAHLSACGRPQYASPTGIPRGSSPPPQRDTHTQVAAGPSRTPTPPLSDKPAASRGGAWQAGRPRDQSPGTAGARSRGAGAAGRASGAPSATSAGRGATRTSQWAPGSRGRGAAAGPGPGPATSVAAGHATGARPAAAGAAGLVGVKKKPATTTRPAPAPGPQRQQQQQQPSSLTESRSTDDDEALARAIMEEEAAAASASDEALARELQAAMSARGTGNRDGGRTTPPARAFRTNAMAASSSSSSSYEAKAAQMRADEEMARRLAEEEHNRSLRGRGGGGGYRGFQAQRNSPPPPPRTVASSYTSSSSTTRRANEAAMSDEEYARQLQLQLAQDEEDERGAQRHGYGGRRDWEY